MFDPLKSILEELSRLHEADRQAILKRLSFDERSRLRNLQQMNQRHANVPAQMARMTMPTCSPWLAARVQAIAEERKGLRLATERTLAAIRTLIGRHNESSS